MVDKFMQQDGIETGYFAKRKEQFNAEIAKGLRASTGEPTRVRSKPKHKTDTKKTEPKPELKTTEDRGKERDISQIHPSQLKGDEFVERMRLAREAKAKEK